jgi:transposase
MMGRQATKRELFVMVSLDEYVPEDHLLRAVDRYLDLSGFREHLAESYSHTGRPSVDPELMARMLIIGYCYGIRSERRLCEEVSMNLAYRWFCRLGLKDKVPRSLELFQKSARQVSRPRRFSSVVRFGSSALHGRRPGAGRRVRN